eukprot:gene22897-1382_t
MDIVKDEGSGEMTEPSSYNSRDPIARSSQRSKENLHQTSSCVSNPLEQSQQEQSQSSLDSPKKISAHNSIEKSAEEIPKDMKDINMNTNNSNNRKLQHGRSIGSCKLDNRSEVTTEALTVNRIRSMWIKHLLLVIKDDLRVDNGFVSKFGLVCVWLVGVFSVVRDSSFAITGCSWLPCFANMVAMAGLRYYVNPHLWSQETIPAQCSTAPRKHRKNDKTPTDKCGIIPHNRQYRDKIPMHHEPPVAPSAPDITHSWALTQKTPNGRKVAL